MKVYGLRLSWVGSDFEDDEGESMVGEGPRADVYSGSVEWDSGEQWFLCGLCGGIFVVATVQLSWVASFGAFFGR